MSLSKKYFISPTSFSWNITSCDVLRNKLHWLLCELCTSDYCGAVLKLSLARLMSYWEKSWHINIKRCIEVQFCLSFTVDKLLISCWTKYFSWRTKEFAVNLTINIYIFDYHIFTFFYVVWHKLMSQSREQWPQQSRVIPGDKSAIYHRAATNR